MAKSVRIPRTGSPRRALTQLAGVAATGALHIGTDDCLYLVGGEVVFAESASSPGIGELLTASGRLAAQTWQAALATGGAAGKADVRPGAWLVQQGHLTHGELELCVLGAIYDAAYFALGSASALLRFVDGETHGMGAVTSVDAAVLGREAARRRKLLDEIYPEPGLDIGPVVPVTRPPVPRVVLTTLQWEIVGRADGTLTPAGLARRLGRAGYAVLTEVRRMAAAGLVALPPGAIPLPVHNGRGQGRPEMPPRLAGTVPYTDQAANARVDSLREVSPRGDLARGDSAQGDSSRGDSARGDSARGDSARGDSARGDSARGDSARGDSARGDSARGDSARGDSARGGTAPADSARGGTAAVVPRRRTPTAAERTGSGAAPNDGAAMPIRAAVPAPAPPGSLPALPRRAPGERLPTLPEPPQSAAPSVPADEALLKRIRTALKALR